MGNYYNINKTSHNNLKVLHLIGSLKFGGAEKQLINLLNNLNLKTKHLIVLCEKKDQGFYTLLNRNIKNLYISTKLRYFYFTIYKIVKYIKGTE